MTFKVCNLGSNYPYLLQKMGFVDSLTHTTVLFLSYVINNVLNFYQLQPISYDILNTRNIGETEKQVYGKVTDSLQVFTQKCLYVQN